MAETCVPTVDEFAEFLQHEERWYQLGIFLGASRQELNAIHDLKNHSACDILLLLIELYDCLEKKGKPLTWKAIATALRRINNHTLAEKIYAQHRTRPEGSNSVPNSRSNSFPPLDASTNPLTHPVISSDTATQTRSTTHSTVSTTSQTSEPANDSLPDNVAGAVLLQDEHCKVSNEYHSLVERFHELLLKAKNTFIKEQIDLDVVQDVLRRECGLPALPQEKTTPSAVFTRVEEQCSIINFHVLAFLVKNLFSNETALLEELKSFKVAIDRFKSSANMVELVTLIKSKQTTPTGEQKMVTLKVREFWNKFSMKQFEIIINEIFLTLYHIMRHISVTKGCICLNWIIPDIDTTELLPVLPLELVRLIGVIYLHIGSDVIYNIEGEGCESIEAAMIQAIELKNTRAIELLLAVGCNPEVATYHGDNAVTNIVNIRAIESKKSSSSSGSSHSVDHVCILGHNKHVVAIVDPANGGGEPEECSSCIVKEKMVKHLHQENNMLQQKQGELYLTIQNKDSELNELHFLKEKKKLIAGDKSTEGHPLHQEYANLHQKVDALQLEKKNLYKAKAEAIKKKDAEIAVLKKSFEILKKEKDDYRVKNEMLKSHLSSIFGKSIAVLPCRWRRVGVKAEMKVKVITRDNSSGKELATGGSEVRAILTCNEGECPVTDNNDGTYTVSVIPQQLGQHQLSITVNGQYIQGSPFILDIVPQRDYTKLNKPVQKIYSTRSPRYIAFSYNGDMFVTSDDHRIHIYKNCNKENTIGSGWGRGKLQFQHPYGIDINGGVVCVAEYASSRIQELATGGEFIGIFGKEGSAIGQFSNPYDVKISPDGKVYVADTGMYRVQVFNPDWSVSHVIDGKVPGDCHFSSPRGIAFDPLSGNVHVAGYSSSSVIVFNSNGQFVRRYGDERHTMGPTGIAVDPSGFCLVNDYDNGRISIFDPKGTFIRSVSGLNCPYGVSISPVDESVWIADTSNDRLLQY